MYENLIKRLQSKFDYSFTQGDVYKIVSWKEMYKFNDNIIIEAAKRAVKSKGNKISLSYVEGILKNWYIKGVEKYSDILETDEDYAKKKQSEKENKETLGELKKKVPIEKLVKNFVLDTNILIHNPYSLYKFDDNNIYICHAVIEELDNFKNERSERGQSSREAHRQLKALSDKGDILKGISINDKGGKVFTFIEEELDFSLLPAGWSKEKLDNIILLSTIQLSKRINNVILVTNDCNMQLKAKMLGIRVEEYKNDRISPKGSLYEGRVIAYTYNDAFEQYAETDIIDTTKIKLQDRDGIEIEFTENEYVLLHDTSNHSLLGQYSNKTVRRIDNNQVINGLKARNLNQNFFINSLKMLWNIRPFLIVNGPAGTGKTLLAVAAGLQQVMDEKIYKRVLVCRSNTMMDENIGALPGTEQEKINPLLRGLYDNLEVLLCNDDDSPAMRKDKIQELFDRGYLCTESLSYFRGRSINNTFIIIDEAQNLSARQLLSIVTRVGFNSRLVLLGDINQVDNTRLDSQNCGLTYAINRMKGSPLTDIITFSEKDCERSALAKEAAERLKI